MTVAIFKAILNQRIIDLHYQGNVAQAMLLTRLWISWEQAIHREQIYKLKKQTGISLKDIYGQ